MLNDLRENFNEEVRNIKIKIENIKNNQSEMKNTVTQKKNTLRGINRLDDAEDLISNLKEKVEEITESEQQKKIIQK